MEIGMVYVVDDDINILDSMRSLVEALNYKVKCFGSAQHFLDQWDDTKTPSCIILDLKMPEMDGLELQDRLKALGVETPIIMVSGQADIRNCVSAMKLGAVDFLEKPYRSETLVAAIKKALERDRLRLENAEKQRGIEELFGSLLPQENAVLDLMVNGTPNKQIASELDISLRTVQFRRSNIMKKLRVSTRAELVRLVSVHSPRSLNLN